MFFTLLAAATAQAAAPAPAAAAAPVVDPRMARMAALYDEVCLKAFPDDKAVDKALAAHGATPLTAEQVRVTLVDDPGRGWQVPDEGTPVLVFLELPTYHACSVRWNGPAGKADLSAYRAVSDPYLARYTGWLTLPPMEMDRGDIHVAGVTTARMTGDGSDALMMIEQSPTDPVRRAAGEGGVDRRFVHQMRTR